jgi:outer membrane translocation and assembly module TamA
MRVFVRYLLISLIVSAGYGQMPSPEPVKNVLIGTLVIQSNTLPHADRESVVRLFEHKAFLQGEIGQRIRQALRNMGYYKAMVDEPVISPALHGEGMGADVRVKVDEGRQYRLGEIRFQKETVFPSSRLRVCFLLQDGDLFNASKFGEGLENIRELYGTMGDVNLVATPQAVIDESQSTLDLVIDVDEGKPHDFGRLYLEGAEPYPGAAQALFNSWKPLEGKRFNSVELHRWFAENKPSWKVTEFWRAVNFRPPDPEGHVVNVTLSQWDP